jgi:hypothetical protein
MPSVTTGCIPLGEGILPTRDFRLTGEIVSSFLGEGGGFGFLSWIVEELLRGILDGCIVPFVRGSEETVVVVMMIMRGMKTVKNERRERQWKDSESKVRRLDRWIRWRYQAMQASN